MEGYTVRPSTLSVQTLKRLPEYHHFLLEQRSSGIDYVSAPTIAFTMGLNEVQVRKDLAAVSEKAGKPRKGFAVCELIRDIEACLGYDNRQDAVLVGAGKLGRALLDYRGFEDRGVRIVAAFDTCEAHSHEGQLIFPMDKLPSLCKRLRVRIGIITVPETEAQDVCDELVSCGVRAIWNFAPVHLHVPPNVLVHNENLAASLTLLARQMAEMLEKERGDH